VESFLDIVWLVLFIPSFCLWVRRRSDVRFAQFSLAVICLLVLLYPVVSACDDVRAATVSFEETTPTKKISKACSATKSGNYPVSGFLVNSRPWELCAPDRLCNLQIIITPQFPLLTVRDSVFARAPPNICS